MGCFQATLLVNWWVVNANSSLFHISQIFFILPQFLESNLFVVNREWLKWWIKEIPNVSWISWVKLLIELASVVAVDKQGQGTFKRIETTREASRRPCQTRQVVTQFSIVPFHQIRIGLAFRNIISTPVIPQAVIGIKGVTEILLGLGRMVYHLLNSWLSALPDDFPDVDEFIGWQQDLGRAQATIRRRLIALRMFYDYLA